MQKNIIAMALIKCEVCGLQISEKAESCPHCGASVEKKKFCKDCVSPILQWSFTLFCVSHEILG